MEFLATIMTDGKPVNDQYEVTWTDDLGNKLQVRFRLVTSRKLSFLLNTSNFNVLQLNATESALEITVDEVL